MKNGLDSPVGPEQEWTNGKSVPMREKTILNPLLLSLSRPLFYGGGVEASGGGKNGNNGKLILFIS